MEERDLVGVELHAHLVDLLAADAVLARDAAARRDAQLEDLAAERFRAVEFAGPVRVEQDQRVHVAVTRVEHVRDRQPVFG